MATTDIRGQLDALVEREELTPAQAALVAAHLSAPTSAPRRAPVAVEALGYLGAALSAAALVRLADHVWALLEAWAQVSTLLLVAAALWAGGAWVRTPGSTPAADRLAGVLWLLSAGAFTGAAGVMLDAVDAAGLVDLSAGELTVLLGVAAGTAAAPMWWARRRALQLLVLLAAVLTTACGGLVWAEVEAPWAWGLLVTALGIAWMVLAWGRLLAPRRAGLVLGALLAAGGPQLIAVDAELVGLLAGVAVAIGLLTASVIAREAALAGIGTVAATAYLLQSVAELLPGELAWTVGLLVAGVMLLAGSLATFRLARGHAGRNPAAVA